jgi:hypothetical protein
MGSEENHSCKCCDNNAFVSYCTRKVSFYDNISSMGFEFMSPKGLLVWVFLFEDSMWNLVFTLPTCVFEMWKIEDMAVTSLSFSSSTPEG